MKILAANQEKVPTTSGWQEELKSAIRDVDSLLKFVGLQAEQVNWPSQPPARFPIRVPRSFARRIVPGDPRDPLLAQILTPPAAPPSGMANGPLAPGHPSWQAEPLADKQFETVPGLLHKYHGRVLLLLTGACAIHCRYCFRQNFDYSTTRQGHGEAIAYLRQETSVSEVILSGGDPLLKTDAQLAGLLEELESIPHLRRLRIHTRTPVVLPSRVTPSLLEMLAKTRLTVSVVLHVNHAQEIDGAVQEMCGKFRSIGVVLLNQSVLLRGVNADFAAQYRLCEDLVNLGVLPYYLHLLDPIDGAQPYWVPDEVGIGILEKLRQFLPGYAVPRLVREIPGQPHKVVVEKKS